MSVRRGGGDGATRGAATSVPPLVAAYCEGLGLVAIALIRGRAGLRIAALGRDDGRGRNAEDTVEARWWCMRASDAERVVAAATIRSRRRAPEDEREARPCDSSAAPSGTFDLSSVTGKSIVTAAKRLGVTLHTDDETFAEATRVIARVDEEMARLKKTGELKTVNSSYRTYRIEASARGEKVLRYSDWMERYRETLVRKLATTLRYV